eukprot:s125_g19.t1
MQFLYEGRVCLNGKELRAWTAARAELQGTFVSAMDYMRHPASDAETCAAQQVNAIDIAKVLLESFVAPPVTKCIFGDDESQSLRRVATIMTTQYTHIVLPLKQFVESQMKLPLVMHDVVKHGLTTLLGFTPLFLNSQCKRMELVDMLCKIQACLESFLPFAWLSFAVDVAELWVPEQKFVEGTQEAGRANLKVFTDFITLQKFIELRVKYLLQIVASVCQCADITLTDVDSAQLKFLSNLATEADAVQSSMELLAAFDSILSAKDWGSRWAAEIKPSKCIQDLLTNIQKFLRIAPSEESLECRSSALAFLRKKREAGAKAADANAEEKPEAEAAQVKDEVEALDGGQQRQSELAEQDLFWGSWLDNCDSDSDFLQALKGEEEEAKNKAKDAEEAQNAEGAAEKAEKAQLEAVTVVGFNEYMSPQMKAEVAKSPDVKALKIPFGAAFLKKLESQLNVVVWDMYHALTDKQEHIIVNLKCIQASKAKPDALQATYPCPASTLLPFANRVQTIQCKGSIWFGKFFGVARCGLGMESF